MTSRLPSGASRSETSASVMSALRANAGAASASAAASAASAAASRRRRAHAGPGERLTWGVASAPAGASKNSRRVEAEQPGDDHRREDLDQRVVGLDRVVVDAAGDRDLVLGLAQVVLQLGEVRRRLELGVGLGDDRAAARSRCPSLPSAAARLGRALGGDRRRARLGRRSRTSPARGSRSPCTDSTSAGIRSWRRRSATSICDQLFSVASRLATIRL